jgi:hypothetical protein
MEQRAHAMQKADGEENLTVVKASMLVPVVQAGAIERVPRQQVNSANNHRSHAESGLI